MRIIMVAAMVAVSVMPHNALAQDSRAVVPYPRTNVGVETIDPMSGMPKNTFCTGMNAIDIRLTNATSYPQVVSVLNRDTKGMQRTLFTGQLPSGVTYLSRLLGTQLALNGPAGTEAVWLTSGDMNMMADAGNQVSYYVQDCGGFSGGMGQQQPWMGYAQVFAQIMPNVLENGQKGTITVQTSAGAQPNGASYIEILNSYGQLWKRIPVTKAPFDYYQVTLPVGAKTKAGVLTYTVNVVMDAGYGQPQRAGSTQFAFQIVPKGSLAMQQQQYGAYSGYPMGQGMPYYGMQPSFGATGYDMNMMPTHPAYVPAAPYSSYGADMTGGAFKEERSVE